MKSLITTLLVLISVNLFSAELSFDEALKGILNKNVDLPSATASLGAATTTALASKLSFLPTLALEKGRTQFYKSDLTKDDTSITSTVNVFRFGSDWFKMSAASSNEQSVFWNKKLVEYNAEYEAATILLDYISQGLSLNALKEYAKVKQQAFKVAQARTDRGLLSLQESQKTEIDLATAEAQLENSELNFLKTKSRLLVALGNTDVTIAWPWVTFIEKQKHLQLSESSFDLEKCPQFKKAKYDFEMANSSWKSARSSLFPSVDLSYVYNTSTASGNTTTEQIGLIKLSIPIFNGLTDYAYVGEQHAAAITAQNNLEKTSRELTSSWTEKSNDLLINSKNAIKGQQVLKLAHTLYEDSFKRFEQGRSSVNDLLMDQGRLLDSQTLAIESWYKAHL